MSVKENYAVNHRLVTDLPLVISGWLKVDRRSGTRINVDFNMGLTTVQRSSAAFDTHTNHSAGLILPARARIHL